MRLLSAGSNSCGQLSNGTNEDSLSFLQATACNGSTPTLTAAVKKMAFGGNHTLVLLEDGHLWACGDASNGQLASLGTSRTLTEMNMSTISLKLSYVNIVDIAAAWQTSFVVLHSREQDDMILSMGANDFGDLGIGFAGKGTDESMKVVNNVPLDQVLPNDRIPGTLKVLEISAGPHHTLVLLEVEVSSGLSTNVVAGWGASRHGQLGAVDPNWKEKCKPLATVLTLQHQSKPVALSVGNSHSMVLHSDGNISSFGSNKKSQLLDVNGPQLWQMIRCTWNGTYAVSQPVSGVPPSLTVYASGSNQHHQLGLSDTSVARNVIQFPFSSLTHALRQLSTGSEHCLALFEENETGKTEVWGWGWNEHGNLGLGHTHDVCPPCRVWPPGDEVDEDRAVGEVHSVWVGCGTSWIVLS